MAVDDYDLLATVARHLVGSFLQQVQLQPSAVGNGPRLVLGFEDLSEVVFGIDNRVLLCSTMERHVADVDQISAERQLRTMLFDDAKREEAGALGLLNRFHKVSRGQFLPLDGERLRQGA